MEPNGDELTSGQSRVDFQYLLTAVAGLMIILYVICKQSMTNNLEMRDNRTYHGNADFTQCQSPDCVRCQQPNTSQQLWRERMDHFIETQSFENQMKLCELHGSFQTIFFAEAPHREDETMEKQVTKTLNPTTYLYPRLKCSPWYDIEEIYSAAHTRDVQLLKDEFQSIRQDFDRVFSDYSEGNEAGWTRNNIPSGSWLVFHIFNQGERMEDSCLRCPRTVRVLQGLETFMSGVLFGYACFSVLQPGSHITPHYGPCNVRVRCHLGLYIPSRCSLTVARDKKQWKEGDCLLFDDSFLHEAENMSHDGLDCEKRSRVIFMVDLWHPGLNDLEKEALRHVFVPR